jgi:integrase
LPVAHDRYNNKTLVPAALKAGLPEGTSSHDLRHHFASVLLKAGVPVTDVAKYLGHKNTALVISTYGHWIPGGEDVARKVIESAWRTARTAAPEAPAAQGRPG